MTHAGLERPTTHDPHRTWETHNPWPTPNLPWSTPDLMHPRLAMEPWPMEKTERIQAYGLVRWLAVWPVMVVACSGASDSGSGHGGLVMVFISTMGFRFEDERTKQEIEGRKRKWKEIMRKEVREESDNKKLFFTIQCCSCIILHIGWYCSNTVNFFYNLTSG